MEEKNSEKKERKMRDSGIPWIGEVPEGWKVGRIKDIIDVLTDFTANGSFADLAKNVKYIDDEDYARLIRLTDLRDNLNNAGVFVDENSYSYLSKSKLFGGEILVANVGAYAGLFCEMPMINKPATLGPNMFLLKPNKKMLSKYLYYIGISPLVWGQLTEKSTSSAQPKLNKTDIKTTYILIPPLDIQQKLVSFLDSKCSEIDTLIENLRARMESAKEYKKAVITEAVTKGLDKDAKMKDSGIEWIGKIPEGWSFPKITHILDYTHPYPIGDGDHGSIKATDYTEYGIPFIRVQNLGFATDLCLDNVVYISEAQNRTIQNSTLKPNDILFAKTGATIGKVGIVPESIKKANTTSHVGKITVSESIVPKYIFYVLSSNIGYRQFWDIAAQKSTRPELSIDEIKTIRVLLPKTKEEQQRIVDYLDSKCSEIDTLLQNYEDQIATLEEYKKSLIYEYVTGKKEVPAA